ncbi:MAG: RAD55 family ATPase [Candidatus Sigynarchaeota archaeon]
MAKKQPDRKFEVDEKYKIDWIDPGIDGLLNFIPGLPRGDAILVRGEPGTGKTILCLQFLHKGAELGEKCLYITTEETPETVARTGAQLWQNFPKYIESGQIKVMNLSIGQQYASEQTLIKTADAIEKVLEGFKSQPGVARICVDSLSSLERRLDDPTEFREVFMRILLECKKTGATSLFSAEGIPADPGITEYLVDHLIYLDYAKHDVIWTRVFILRKSRSVPLHPEILKLNIEAGGLYVEEIPISLKPVWFASKI